MKRFILLFFIIQLFNNAIFPRDYNTYLGELFFGRQPSARADALGKGYASVGGDIYSVFYNPAGLSLAEGLIFNSAYSSPYYIFDKANYSFLGLGYCLNKYLKIGINRYYFDWGLNLKYEGHINEPNTYRPYNSSYTLTVASNPIKNLHLGLNSNYVLLKIDKNLLQALSLDFGILGQIPLSQNDEHINSLQIGGSCGNFAYMEFLNDIENKSEVRPLLVTTRLGISYLYGSERNLKMYNLRYIQVLSLIEYQDILNKNYYPAYRLGSELTIFEILSLRIGYYWETFYNDDDVNPSKYTINQLTYGFGLAIPINVITENKINLSAKLDYTNLPQPSHTMNSGNYGNYKSVNFSIIYKINSK